MNILLIGSGGREHAMAWKLAESPRLQSLFIAPGNGGTADFGENVSLDPNNFQALGKFCLEQRINMIVAGPEEPLVNGLADYFQENPELASIPVIGPPRAGAMLEGSKAFSKRFMERHSIPTARYGEFGSGDLPGAMEFLNTLKPPFVLKADGLAAGKGVLILEDRDAAETGLRDMLTLGKFGKAGSRVVIEEFLPGIELSMFILTDGNHFVVLPEAKDYKRIGDGDTGPNTGGMGAVSPVPFADEIFKQKVRERIIIPTVEGLKSEQIPYRGFIFFGLMNVNGDPFVIEYNCRMGDPETEVVMPRIQNDLVELFSHTAAGTLGQIELITSPEKAVTVMMVSGGYPGNYEKGKVIHIETESGNARFLHAGTQENKEGQLVTSGGRVMAVTCLGSSLKKATADCYKAITKIRFDGMNYRKDIGADLNTYLER